MLPKFAAHGPIRRSRLLAVALLGAAVLLVPLPALAQSNGNIAGRVSDTDGNPIAGATVTIISVDRGVSRDTRTNSDGAYMLRGFRPEMYVVRVEADGFATREQQIKINFGMNTIDVPMPPAVDTSIDYDRLNTLYNDGFQAYQARDWAAAKVALGPLVEELGDLQGEEVERMLGSSLDILGQAELMLGEHEAAIAVYEQRLERHPASRATVLPWLGQAYAAAERFDEAVEVDREAVALAPEDAGLHYNAAAVMMRQQLDAEAIPLMERALELRPEFPQAHKQLGYAYLRQGDYAKSIESLKTYLEQDPEAADRAEIEGMVSALEAQIQG